MLDKWLKTILAIMVLFLLLSLNNPQARADNPWGFGTDIGFLADTADDTVFSLSFQGDYFLDSEFSIGPQLIITPGGDLTQITFAGIARYHIPLGSVSLIPFGGLGFVYADYESGRRDDDDASYIFPFGATAAFHISRKVSLASTLIFTFQDLDLNNRRNSDNFNIGLLFGFRFHP
ncbi:MAG: porin family protein [Nitrospirota bacterium]|nr:porin family protein [Nitrospirota bacterium]